MEKICTKACERTGTGIAASAAHVGNCLILTTPYPPGKEPYAITFTAPSGFAAEEYCTLNGSQLAVVDADGEPLQNGWKAGVPVTLMIQGGKAYCKTTLAQERSAYVHTKSGTVHELSGMGNDIQFHAAVSCEDGDTFQVNGRQVTAQTMDGQSLAAGDFAAGSDVTAILNQDVLTFQFKSYTEQLNEKADAGHTHMAEEVGASPAIHVHSTDDITSGILPIERGGTGRSTGCVCNATGAGAHNSHYRGENLGSSVTDAQYSVIAAGTFDGLYIGDYWVIDGVTYRIAAFDYYFNCGDINCTTHHAVIVPDKILYNYAMNDTNTTEGGYVGSKMYTEGLTQAKATINTAFGSAHILNHRQYLCNAVTKGKPSGGSWYESTVELMTEQNMYGGKMFSCTSDGLNVFTLYTIDKSQYPLFALRPDLISNRNTFWLREVITDIFFASTSTAGDAACGPASVVSGVRPSFCIKF